jgi:hypothetical protein
MVIVIKVREDGCGLTWTHSRSALIGQMVKAFFHGFLEKWILGNKMDKMVREDGSSIRLQKISKLSKEGGEGHSLRTLSEIAEGRYGF